MPAPILDVVRGALKLNQLTSRQCFDSWEQFLEALPNLLSVEVPTTVSGVIFSSTEPGEDDRGKLWVFQDTSGNTLGLYTFTGGAWEPFYAPVPNEVRWFYGDSDTPPPGYLPIIIGDAQVPATVVSALTNQYVLISPGRYSFYAARYVGF